MHFPKSLAAASALLASLVAPLVALPAWAVEPFTVRDIKLEGLQRVEPGTVFATMGLSRRRHLQRRARQRRHPRAVQARPLQGRAHRRERQRAGGGGGRAPLHRRRRLRGHQGVRQGRAAEGAARGGHRRRAGLRQGTGRPRRAGAQAAVHRPQSLQRAGHHHRHAAGEQPREPDLHRDRRRVRAHQGSARGRQQGLQRRARCSTCSTRTPAAGSTGTPSPTSTRAPSSTATWRRCAPTTSRAATWSSASSRRRSPFRRTGRR